MAGRTTFREPARRSGASVGTVSRAVEGRPDAAAEREQAPVPAARTPAIRRSQVVDVWFEASGGRPGNGSADPTYWNWRRHRLARSDGLEVGEDSDPGAASTFVAPDRQAHRRVAAITGLIETRPCIDRPAAGPSPRRPGPPAHEGQLGGEAGAAAPRRIERSHEQPPTVDRVES
jgi:hypothetical protein